MVCLFATGDRVSISFSQRGLTVSRAALQAGEVFDASEGELVLRAWKVGNEIHCVHLFSCDVAWPHDVYIFAFPEGDVQAGDDGVHAKKSISVSKYLAAGNGIPAVKQ